MSRPTSATFDRLRALSAIDDPDTREQRDVLEAFTGTPMARIPVGTADDVRAAVDRAREAQRAWADTWPKERSAVIARFADLVFEYRDALMDFAQAETGKARAYAQEEVVDVALTARHYAKVAPGLLAAKRAKGMIPGATDVRIRYQPKGVVGVISPWNYPLTLAASDAVAALMAGNAVVIKPDSQTPYCALAVADLLYRAGLPRELFAVVPGSGGVVGRELVEQVDYLMFTGSTATGSLLAEQAGRRLIGFSAELGGKNAMIVTADADVDNAVEGAVRACYSNSGQLCISIERLYVERPVADEFTRRFAARVERMEVGADYDFAAEMGSLASQAQVDAVTAHVEDAKAKGATVLAGGRPRPDLGPFFYSPTVLSGVDEAMECFGSETFGPLVSIYPVDSVDEAIELANDTTYGLNAAVFAGDPAEGRRIAARLHVGTVNLNEGYAAAWGSTAAPMGGMGASGVGRRHGDEGLLKYTEPQTIATQRVIGIGGIKGVPRSVFLRTVPTAMKALKYVPGR
ncbi:succinate-semialdehyde dehydrogenase / glutarate-semialdehyde dehydrogenase [Williamsia sterculiae]|uniref:succinate-semialdehyde dehydrogenase (NADP(+)) n=1 Tax=Williamsia sterculiae TaxID=1344003 RepID=A0A1N7H9F0_9NOCA|nr:succinate-semialdehyde dehydrogenase / glutarate-semialdehyde dehydrogenase [Williamsia sterculiae]